jgi:c-di-GMP phosphodiesterase
MTDNQKNAVSVSIGRQPVFDKQRKLWGYELFCVGTDDTTESGFPANASTAIHIQSSAYICLKQVTDAGKNIMADFTERCVLENLPYVLPPRLAAVRVFEQLAESSSALESLARLKKDGYAIAVDGFSANAACDSLYRLADIICIGINSRDRAAIDGLLTAAHQYKAILLAMRVHDEGQFNGCREQGFTLFHGPFFKAAERIIVRKLSSNEVVRLNLLKAIEAGDFDVAKLAETVRSDVTVSLRLLAFMNSAAFSFSQKIKSVSQAITLLGFENVKRWLRVVLLSDMNQTKEARELVLLSAQRGMFLELVAKDHDFWGFAPESLHLLGLFSLLDALLGVPMSEIVGSLPLEHKMKAALCRESNSEYLPLLHLAQCLEEARWENGETLIQELNLDDKRVRTAFQSSINWAGELAAL